MELWFHISACVDNRAPFTGDTVNFNTQPSVKKPGHFIAINITGGTGQEQHQVTTNPARTRGGGTDMGDEGAGRQDDRGSEGWQTIGRKGK
eukprot:1482827-Heterocapsa_arctica.AAC.1